jgi:hypothetical protein
LARAPDIFGDILSSGQLSAQTNFNFVTADIPLSSGARRTKIAEHNKALTDDRAFFLFHHFENAVGFTRAPGPNTPPISFTDRSIDRYTIGVERSLAEGLWSIEVRMPFTSGVNIQENSPALPAQPDFQLFSGQVGDISVALKHQLYEDDTLGIAAGLGVTAPTGSDVQGFLPFAAPAAAQFRISNDAIHLLPFIGFVTTPSERCFAHGFLQVDVPTNGNRVIATNGVGGLATGRLNESTLLYLDGSIGYWLHQDPTRRWMRGVAVSGELHYTRSLQSADSMPFFNGVFGDGDGRVEFLNGTIGLHCALTAGTSVRVAAVLPLLGGVRRSFDAEAQAAIIRQF